MNRVIRVFAVLTIATLLSSCGYNTLQTQDEQIKAAQAGILNVYQKRSDVVPNLVNVVKGYAAHESQVLTDVTAARSKIGQFTPPDLSSATPEQLEKYAEAQRSMTGALSRLIAVAESYPQLKADTNFRQLQTTLENLETQAAAARNRYIRSVQSYNGTVRRFPTNLTAMVFGHSVKSQLQFEDEKAIKKPPVVDFSKKG